MIRQSFLKRKPKSDIASQFVGVLSYDNQGRPRVLVVPGSKGKRYHVIVRRTGRTTSLECRCEAGIGHIPCPGNSPRKNRNEETICYHSRAAYDTCAKLGGFETNWCTSQEDADRLSNMIGGTIFNVKSYQNSAFAYVVVRRK